jgi:hypothetical protein
MTANESKRGAILNVKVLRIYGCCNEPTGANDGSAAIE